MDMVERILRSTEKTSMTGRNGDGVLSETDHAPIIIIIVRFVCFFPVFCVFVQYIINCTHFHCVTSSC